MVHSYSNTNSFTLNTNFAFVDSLDSDLEYLAFKIPPLFFNNDYHETEMPYQWFDDQGLPYYIGALYIGQLSILGLWLLFTILG